MFKSKNTKGFKPFVLGKFNSFLRRLSGGSAKGSGRSGAVVAEKLNLFPAPACDEDSGDLTIQGHAFHLRLPGSRYDLHMFYVFGWKRGHRFSQCLEFLELLGLWWILRLAAFEVIVHKNRGLAGFEADFDALIRF